MQSSGRTTSTIEGYSIAYALFAVAIAILIAWFSGHWIVFIPVILIELGLGYLGLGFVVRPMETHLRPSRRDSYFYIIWGSISTLIGIEWVLNASFPGNVPLLFALFIIWMGVIALALVMVRNREDTGAARQ